MADYAIGDVHACRSELEALLERLCFDPATDHLWLTGDLVGRGPEPLETLRLLKSLGPAVESVLGNHDLHCIAIAAGKIQARHDDHLERLLNAPDASELLTWLRQRPLMLDLPWLGYTLVHAGIPPQWNIDTALVHAAEVEMILHGPNYRALLDHLYGNEPAYWQDKLSAWERLRFIVNALTRLRFCDANGALELTENGPPEDAPQGLYPWFGVPGHALDPTRSTLLSGHWSRLGQRQGPGYITLDSGCLWGGELTAVRLDSEQPEFTTVPGLAKQSAD